MARVNIKELHGNKKFRNGSFDTPITPSSCRAAGSSSSSRPSCTSKKEPDPVTRLVNELIRDLSPTNEGSSSWVNPKEGTSSRPSCSGQQALDPVARLVDLELEGYWDIGDPDVLCNKCGAMLWYLERVRKDRNTLHPTFSLCCSDGKITLPLLKQPPQLLLDLLSRRHPLSNHFIDNIRTYNIMFSFTSMGGKIDNSVNQGRGPYTFRMGGQNVHRIGSLLPPDRKTPKFCQLYIYDTEEEVQNRKNAHSPNNPERYNDDLICLLQRMIDAENILAMRFRMARDRLSDDIERDVSIRLISRRETDGRTYNRPTASEVAVLIEGDIGNAVEKRDIIIEKESGELQRISELHPLYLALQYPLLFPHGENGWRSGILHSEASLNKSKKKKPRNQVTMREWLAFHLQDRSPFLQSLILLLAAKLLQQFIVDGYMMVESQRLSFLCHNQGLLRVETYKNLANAVDRGETEPSSAGSRIFMSSSVLQSDGYTIEIMRFVSKRGLRPEDRPDILSRVFKMKLAELMKDRHICGRVIGGTYTIEFQKRGLPHGHILIFLHRDDKFPEAANVDKIISAEIPDPDENPLLYALVKENMIHGPCGKDFPTCPCMVASKCSRNFPKRCIESTTVDDDRYPVYKRREKGFTVVKSGRKLGNEWVVPYNVQLLLKYRAHIIKCRMV
ncbi:uncharacterized protein LOC141639455 [Silene latifolia]|uniref:uncharacterized protein LOC141639455 n=1 Tax=Silene latifolia TaxID=37657 RepID=UPI003D77FA44